MAVLGPDLPGEKFWDFATMTSKDNDGVYILGGLTIEEDEKKDEIYKLSCENSLDTCQWTTLEAKMKYPTHGHIAFHLPKLLAKKFCSA